MKMCMIGNRAHSNNYVPESIRQIPFLSVDGYSAEDDNREAMSRMLDDLGFHPRYFRDYREMLDIVQPDLVCIDGPFEHHAEWAAEALRRRIHVFCEKPLVLSEKSLEEVTAAQRKSSSHIICMMGMRYEPPFRQAKKLVDAGAVGKVMMIRVQKSYHLGSRAAFYHKRETYGGTIPWIGSHALDLMMYFAPGKHFRSVYATQNSDHNAGNGTMESSAQILVTMEDGIQGMASIDYLRPETAHSFQDDRLRIAGTEGIIEVRDGKIFLIDRNGERNPDQEPQERFIFSDFVGSLTGHSSCLISDSEALELAYISLMAQRSADRSEIIQIRGSESWMQ